MKKVRTTIVLPEEELRLIKIMALNEGLTMSELIRKRVKVAGGGMEENSDEEKSWVELAGSLNLGGKEPYKRRVDLYEEHLRRKLSR